jgi:transposase
MEKKILEQYLANGLSTRDISKICGLHRSTISYWINKYNLNNISKYKKTSNYTFNKIDTKEKAYCLGFILGDACINQHSTDICIALRDKEVVYFIQSLIGGNIIESNKFDKQKKRFPSVRLTKKISDIAKFTGGYNKIDRHYPIIRSDLEKYMIQGFFDAEGCITWGVRKDKQRLWHKVSFTSQYKMLEGVQQYLFKKVGIVTKLKPKSDSKCFVLEFANKKDILKFYDHLYKDNDMIVLKRKYLKYNALRLELEEFGEGYTTDNTEPSLQSRKV